MMSVELRITLEGECTCGTPYAPGEEPPPHWHHFESDWGRIKHSDPRPDRGEVGHLVLVHADTIHFDPAYLYRETDPAGRRLWQEYHVTRQGDRMFIHTAYPIYDHGDGIPTYGGGERPPTRPQRWTWELFDAHWADGKGPAVYIGRWPD